MSSDKDNELVLVVKTSKLFPDGIWEGFRELDNKTLTTLINKNAEYLKRGIAETDETHQQIVAQIILKVGNKVFVHRIPQTGSESRLHDKWPIFLGGHINNLNCDLRNKFKCNMYASYLNNRIITKFRVYFFVKVSRSFNGFS